MFDLLNPKFGVLELPSVGKLLLLEKGSGANSNGSWQCC